MNQRLAGTKPTMRDQAAISRFFTGLELVGPGVVQPQQWRPGPAEPGGPAEVTAWCGHGPQALTTRCRLSRIIPVYRGTRRP